ncbi:uncharacterized protein Dyak_GE17176, isoform D [Drosophila yakuba]|uniref:Uncharacterized protein, isoform D n=1 Tax=Drosophila yakuba TaxID=7245 RepID=A0A0R1EAU7_DROYA|nr:uncharacterized protein Dyak_GE17176, isoform D [Drosophila yakuba]
MTDAQVSGPDSLSLFSWSIYVQSIHIQNGGSCEVVQSNGVTTNGHGHHHHHHSSGSSSKHKSSSKDKHRDKEREHKSSSSSSSSKEHKSSSRYVGAARFDSGHSCRTIWNS